jgi:hypothetical protein
MLRFGLPFRILARHLTLFFIVGLPLTAGAQTLTPTDIGTLGGSTSVTAVSSGFVAGNSGGQTYVWSRATGQMTNVGAQLPANAMNNATDVNAAGAVVGGYFEPDWTFATAFYWSPSTGVRQITRIGNYSVAKVFINDNGVVAGVTADGDVFRWTLAGGLENLGNTGVLAEAVTGINKHGDIVGNNINGTAFVFHAASATLTLLNSPGDNTPRGDIHMASASIRAAGISDAGVVVGTYWDFGYLIGLYHISQGGHYNAHIHNSHAFSWTQSGGFTDLGNLGMSPVPGSATLVTFAASASAINSAGMIVGHSALPGGGYAPFTYTPATGMVRLAGASAGDTAAAATGVNDDGVVVGWANGFAIAAMWTGGVFANLTPSFAPQWPHAPLIEGSLVAGNGLDHSWTGHGWVLDVPGALPTQTLTILGGLGNVGDVATNVEYLNPATGQWQLAYLANYAPYGHPVTHPWGNVPGTNRWINYRTDGASDPGASGANVKWYDYRVRFTVPADAINPKMTLSIKVDNFAYVAINGLSTGPMLVGQPAPQNVDAAFSQAVHPGENTITIRVGDAGGLNGFNFRIDLSMQSSEPLEIVPVNPDSVAPVISAPGNVTVEADSASGSVVTFAASAADNVDGAVAVTASPASGSVFPIGTTSVSLTATDAAGNTATASFSVTVQDTTAPNVTAPDSLVAEATGADGAVVSYPAAAATDAVGVTSLDSNPPSGSTFPLGTTTVTTTARDAAGNIGAADFTVSVVDTTAPALTVPANQVLEATSAGGAVATFAATATDAVGVVSLTHSPASGSPFPIGSTTVAVSAADAAGNTTSGSFSITVRDTTAPTVSSVAPSTGTLWPPNHRMVPIALNIVAGDVVGVTGYTVAVSSSEPDNGLGDGDTANDFQVAGNGTMNPSVSLRAERSGGGNGRTYTIAVRAVDAAGNISAPKTTTVFVPKSQGGKK